MYPPGEMTSSAFCLFIGELQSPSSLHLTFSVSKQTVACLYTSLRGGSAVILANHAIFATGRFLGKLAQRTHRAVVKDAVRESAVFLIMLAVALLVTNLVVAAASLDALEIRGSFVVCPHRTVAEGYGRSCGDHRVEEKSEKLYLGKLM